MSGSAETTSGRLEQAYQFYCGKVCPWIDVPNKIFKGISYGIPLVALVAPIGGRLTKIASIMGRSRAAFYASFMVCYAPKLWRRDKESIRGNLFGIQAKEGKRAPKPDRLKAAFYLFYLSFQVAITTSGVLDMMTQFRALKRLKGAMEQINKILPIIVLASNITAIAVTLKAIKQADDRKKAMKESALGIGDDATDTVGTALEAQWIGFEGEEALSLAFLTISSVLGLANAIRNLRSKKDDSDSSIRSASPSSEPSSLSTLKSSEHTT